MFYFGVFYTKFSLKSSPFLSFLTCIALLSIILLFYLCKLKWTILWELKFLCIFKIKYTFIVANRWFSRSIKLSKCLYYKVTFLKLKSHMIRKYTAFGNFCFKTYFQILDGRIFRNSKQLIEPIVLKVFYTSLFCFPIKLLGLLEKPIIALQQLPLTTAFE